jgi:hypothetical protein
MHGPDDQTSGMFSYLSPEQRMRPDHPLRVIRRIGDQYGLSFHHHTL